MGIFSLDLARPIEVEIHSQSCSDLTERLKPFMI
jgi:hypothetical protein